MLLGTKKDSAKTILKKYKYLKEFGITAIVTSHNVGDIEKMCDRLMIITYGSLFYDGDVQSAIKKYSDDNGTLEDALVNVFTERAES